MDDLLAELSMGQPLGDAELLARLVSLVSPALVAPLGNPRQVGLIERLLQQSETIAAAPGDARACSREAGAVSAPARQ
jgi:hypothetical protein